ncbi:hypothetical protein E5676_scaffold862G00630 [Cucumis melo var. makuwa]|uniref:Uncharacterized protein n=1 Tax=Cucumis melo var. makuwa TaxID=1194695 RepID=A0A5A7SVS7_CUCMM|nr:hypothetical protein E6C27_scaffold285G00020 [Cucumis melo var. makuwa]TYK25761.1 hypothetical protein E5676_scaffold862G00630 [Cucumis melo var. makuwa]
MTKLDHDNVMLELDHDYIMTELGHDDVMPELDHDDIMPELDHDNVMSVLDQDSRALFILSCLNSMVAAKCHHNPIALEILCTLTVKNSVKKMFEGFSKPRD